jgi:hypothetical protein
MKMDVFFILALISISHCSIEWRRAILVKNLSNFFLELNIFGKMVDRKVVPFDEFYYQLKLTHVFQKHPVYLIILLLLTSSITS